MFVLFNLNTIISFSQPIEHSLNKSRNLKLREACDQLDVIVKVQEELAESAKSYDEVNSKEKQLVEDTISLVLTEKGIKKELHPQ